MKKKLLIFACVLTSMLSFAQFSENFNAGIPGTMTQTFQSGSLSWGSCGGNLGGAICPIGGSGLSASFFQNNGTAVTTSLESPLMNLSSGAYRLTFNHIQRDWQGDINSLTAQISLNSGTTWTNMVVFANAVETATMQSIVLNGFGPLTANTKIRLQARNNWGYSLIVDDVMVSPITTNDLELQTVNLASIIMNGSVPISGTVTNNGATTINALTINYAINGGANQSQTINGLSIGTGQSYNFSHNVPWNATVGQYSVAVSVASSNITDSNLANNSLTRSVAVASNSTIKKPLLEKFTASTCGPCASFNINSFNSFYTANNSEFSLICYHLNFPNGGDPYYIAAAGTRRQVYSVSGVPDLVINSINVAPGFVPSTTQLNTKYNQAKTEVGYFTINAAHQISGTTITGSANIMPFLTGAYKLYVVVIEKQTVNNTGSNGETSFKHVMMKMFPDANGQTINTVANTMINAPFTIDMAGTFVEDINDLQVVIFVQPTSLNSVLQSAYSTEGILNTNNLDAVAKVKLYPNPSTGIVSISSNDTVDFTLIDVLGKTVFTKKAVANNDQIDLSNLAKGVYLVKLQSEKGTSTQKLILE